MTPRTWAEEMVPRFQFCISEHGPEPLVQATTVATLLLKEHQRAVRIVKRYLQQYGTEGSPCELICNDILAELERGHT